MKVIVTGINGQVGRELLRTLPEGLEVIGLDRNAMDLSNPASIRDAVRALRPEVIINPAAYTAVDQAEREPELARRINADAPAILAEEARKLGAALIHYSTDYVFDGTKSCAYEETDATNPLNVYGATKLAGEQAIAASGAHHLILRTSWVYGAHGKNFLLTMLRLARERDELRVVDDQWGAPTWAGTIAQATAGILAQSLEADAADAWWRERSGVYHMTAQGKTTWCRFAAEIIARAAPEPKPRILAITTEKFPTPAQRPKNSVLSNEKFGSMFGMLPDWRDGLAQCLRSMEIRPSWPGAAG